MMLIPSARLPVLYLVHVFLTTGHALPSWPQLRSGQRQDAVRRDITTGNELSKRSIAGGIELRIDPLGNSITYGTSSSDGNGYRQHLQQLVLQNGNPVRFIGSVSSGTMNNNDNEGHPGYTIDQIGGQAHNSLPERPNVVLLMAGTNDIVQVLNLTTAPERLGNLIDLVLSYSPDAAVIVATLTPLLDPTREANREAYNQAIPGVVASRANAGKHVLLADMGVVTTSQFNTADGIHPNDEGYALMAQVWYSAISAAGAKGWIQPAVAGVAIPPEHNGTTPAGGATSCPVFPGWQNPVQIAPGAGSGPNPGDAVRFADINGDGLADYIVVGLNGSVDVYLNEGPASWPQWNYIGSSQSPHPTATRQNVVFADVNCDGYADYLVINEVGGVTAYYNTHNFPSWGGYNNIAYVVGTNGSTIRIADVNGDGCADYLVVGDQGQVQAYLNLGPSYFPNWQVPPVVIAPGFGFPGSEVRFADLNGDSLADYLVVQPDNGAVHAWISIGPNGNPPWSYNDIGEIAWGVGVGANYVIFADINGDKLADYLMVDEATAAVTAWQNPCPLPMTTSSSRSSSTPSSSSTSTTTSRTTTTSTFSTTMTTSSTSSTSRPSSTSSTSSTSRRSRGSELNTTHWPAGTSSTSSSRSASTTPNV